MRSRSRSRVRLRAYLECRSKTVGAAPGRSAVKIAGGIFDDAGERICSVAAGKIVQHGLSPASSRGGELEYGAVATGGAPVGRPIERPRRIHQESPDRIAAVIAAIEIPQ